MFLNPVFAILLLVAFPAKSVEEEAGASGGPSISPPRPGFSVSEPYKTESNEVSAAESAESAAGIGFAAIYDGPRELNEFPEVRNFINKLTPQQRGNRGFDAQGK